MMVFHDLYCRQCATERYHQRVDIEKLPQCPNCRSQMQIAWLSGRAPSTDVYGSPRVSRVLSDDMGRDLEYTSSRERDKLMAKYHGCEPRGDAVGGARAETYRRGAKIHSLGSVGDSHSRHPAKREASV